MNSETTSTQSADARWEVKCLAIEAVSFAILAATAPPETVAQQALVVGAGVLAAYGAYLVEFAPETGRKRVANSLMSSLLRCAGASVFGAIAVVFVAEAPTQAVLTALISLPVFGVSELIKRRTGAEK